MEHNKFSDSTSSFRSSSGRSPAYPFLSLEKAVERVKQVVDAKAGYQKCLPEHFYMIWDVGPQSSVARQTLAALNHFGLVDYIGRGDDRKVKLSDLALRVVSDETHELEKHDLIIRTALKPAIYADLYDSFGPSIENNEVLESYLVSKKDYNQAAAKILVQSYKSTLEYAGIIKPFYDSNSVLNVYSNTSLKVGDYIYTSSMDEFLSNKPKRIRSFSQLDGKYYVYVKGSEEAIPISQVRAAQREHAADKPYGFLLNENNDNNSLEETVWLRGPLSQDVSYTLTGSGKMGLKEVKKLIKILTLLHEVLDYDDVK